MQISKHMDQYNMWHGSLHSYRKQLSTSTALSQVSDTIFQASDDTEIAASLAVDESAAFDSLHHRIILDKMKFYRLHQDTIDWVKYYISARSQFVSLGAQDSRIKPLTTAVPQGSILGPPCSTSISMISQKWPI